MSDQIMKASTGAETLVAGKVKERSRAVAIPLRRRLLSASSTGLVYLFLIIMTIFALFPIFYVLQASLAGGQNLYTTDLRLLPAHPTFDNYIYDFTNLPLGNWLMNTLLVAGFATLVGLVFSMTGAYALSRFRFRGRAMTLTVLLALQAFPALLGLVAYYLLLQALGLNNTLIGLSLIYAAGALAFNTWNIKGYFDTIPVELEQAALIDGATPTQAFLRVALPLAVPALAASGLLIFIGAWNEFGIANYILSSNETQTNIVFALGLYNLQGDFRTPWGYFASASVIVSVPLIIFFLWAQRFFQSGLTVGAVKG